MPIWMTGRIVRGSSRIVAVIMIGAGAMTIIHEAKGYTNPPVSSVVHHVAHHHHAHAQPAHAAHKTAAPVAHARVHARLHWPYWLHPHPFRRLFWWRPRFFSWRSY